MLRNLREHPRCLVLLCAALAYANSLHGPFVFDDAGVIVRHGAVHSLSAWWAEGWTGMRPLLQFTYAICSSLGAGVLGFHVFNLAVHLGVVVLVMALTSAAVDRERVWPFAAVGVPELVAGLLFAIHPVQTEAVTYISGRSASLMTFFYVGAMVAYVAGVRARKWMGWAVAAPLLWAGAMLVKETAATLPLALLVWELCVERTKLRNLVVRQGLFWAVAVGAFAAAVMHPRYYAMLLNLTGARPLLDALQYQVHGVMYLVSRLFLVHRLCIDPGLGIAPPSPSVSILGGIGLVMLSMTALVLVRRAPPVALGLLWYLLHLFIPYVLLPRDDVMNERHGYLAHAGLFMAAGVLWHAWSAPIRQRRLLAWVGGAIVTVLALFTVSRNMDYANPIRLWEQTARVAPHHPRAHNNLGVSYEAAGRREDARAAYQRALALEPRYVSARRNLARVEAALADPPLER